MSRIKKKFIRFGTGTDEVNSRDIPANYTPTNYTPAQVAAEGNTQVSAHLKGIDTVLASAGGGETTGSFSLANNQSSLADITPLLFNGATIRGVEIRYSIYRTSSTTEEVAVGSIQIGYKTTAAAWTITYETQSSNAGVVFDITNAGQLQYTSTNYSGTGYSGVIKFSYKTFPV